jgi:transcriptional regulator with XRE-family HTH domain
MRKSSSTDELRVAVLVLRSLRGWSQQEFADEARVNRVQISLFESGKRVPASRTLDRLVAAAGVPPTTFQALLAVLRQALTGEDIQMPAGEGTSSPLIQAVAAAQESALARLLAVTSRTGRHTADALRRAAVESWGRLRIFSGPDRRVLVDGAPEYQTWAFCELLCAESLRVAGSDPKQAIELADLALRVAGRVGGEKSWRSRLQSYALAHIGNARRVADDFNGAEAAFRQAQDLWRANAEDHAEDTQLLDRGLGLALYAALRKDQRRFSEALALQEQAVALAGPRWLGDILMHLAVILEQGGDHDRAIQILERAKSHIDPQRSPRSDFGVRFNLSVNLVQLRRYAEAAELLPEVREMAVQLRNELDLLRVRWLEARIAAGQGQKPEAIQSLAQVREGFLAHNLGYDAALASLELAVLYLEEDRTGEVKELAREMAPIFKAQGVHREVLAALRLFCEAAERDSVTLEMARRLVQYLERARQEPKLRFETR